MVTLFYLFGVLAILWELKFILEPKKTFSFVTALEAKVKNKENTDGKENTFLLLNALYMFWGICGMLFITNEWPLFALLILISLFHKKNIVLKWIDSLISLSILIFATVNHSYLQLDIAETIKHLF